MAGRPIVSVEFLQADFDRAFQKFASEQAPEIIDTAVRKVAFDVIYDTQAALNGVDGLPKRIDTGRLRGGWRFGAEAAGLPTGGLVSSPANQAGDGSGSVTSGATRAEAVVQNNVRYARYVEDGTTRMRGGHHLKRALVLAKQSITGTDDPAEIRRMVKAAFYGRAT